MKYTIAALAAWALMTANAAAFTFTDSPSTHDASNFADPDDHVPFPHLSDNGQVDSGGTGSMGFSGESGSQRFGADAFTRAQERMQQ